MFYWLNQSREKRNDLFVMLTYSEELLFEALKTETFLMDLGLMKKQKKDFPRNPKSRNKQKKSTGHSMSEVYLNVGNGSIVQCGCGNHHSKSRSCPSCENAQALALPSGEIPLQRKIRT